MRHELDLDSLSPGIHKFYMDIIANGIAQDIHVPIMVLKGSKPGPVLGVTAAVHGNELNGLKIIQKLFKEVDGMDIAGTLVGVPVVNVPALLNHERYFSDNEDINRIMPGREDGNQSQVYAYRIVNRIIANMEFLLDLHTASFGRVNSYYIRANMRSKMSKKLAQLQNADIILNNEGGDGTLRAAATDLGIHAITLEVGDPNKFQKGMIRSGLEGIFNVMSFLKMIDDEITVPKEEVVTCQKSYWIYADRGGVLEVYPDVTDMVKQGEEIAVIRNVFGEKIKSYVAPEDGIVIGKSTHPIGQTGSRILHLGII
ncbi:MAG: succinylglutamate desuccinylase/aspartoacylase family protein [Flavobacteriales bacterium]|nr:succinylglutamate desuccinylase/aspartoacylase family protein [Flavobacteriales bacterium]MDG2247120.1 succinylglutamate desuccinylase/aspartoacylase family protein [Flavobacteriales bacterium]